MSYVRSSDMSIRPTNVSAVHESQLATARSSSPSIPRQERSLSVESGTREQHHDMPPRQCQRLATPGRAPQKSSPGITA